MQRKTLKPQWMLSVLSVALLAACGGGEQGTFSPNDPRNQTQNQNSSTKRPKVVDKNDPTVREFLVNVAGIGQQLSPTVVSIDNNNNKRIDPADGIRFDQPGIVSEICPMSECKGYPPPKDNPPNGGNNNGGNNNGGNNNGGNPNGGNPNGGNPNGGNNDDKTKIDPVLMMDVNRVYHDVVDSSTVDWESVDRRYPRDAGVTKITKKRINGQLHDYGGTIDRRFNQIYLYTHRAGNVANSNAWLSSYYRHPGTAGWSYQTFGYFFGEANGGFLDNARDVMVGYQSIGKPTLASEMPTAGSADYNGITHGYYNGNQVTALNKLHADFGRRNISYATTGVSQLHTFEGTDHVIEDKPAFNLSGSASWEQNTGDFKGDIRTAEGLTGKWQGRFYGPNADEVGGVFGLQGTATDGSAVQYVGGFGAER